jgi:hypothetical protein
VSRPGRRVEEAYPRLTDHEFNAAIWIARPSPRREIVIRGSTLRVLIGVAQGRIIVSRRSGDPIRGRTLGAALRAGLVGPIFGRLLLLLLGFVSRHY